MQSFRIFILFGFIFTIISTNVIDQNTFKSDIFYESAADCVSVLTKKYMRCGSLIASISTINYADPIIKLLSDNDCYNFIIRSFQTQEWLIWSNLYLATMKNFTEFQSSFRNISRDLAWNPKAQFFIIIDELKKFEEHSIFKYLLTLNVYNVYMITKSEKFEKLQVNTYNPFVHNACGRSIGEIINIKNCEDIDSFQISYAHLENKLDNCTIDIAGIEDVPNFIYPTNEEYSYLRHDIYGLEQFMLFNIAEQQNITLKYTFADQGADYGVILPNWTTTGFLGYLDNHTADILAGGYLFLLNRMKLFDSVWGYNYASFSVYTPAPGDVRWKKVYKLFSAPTWALIALSYGLVTIVAIYTGQYFNPLTDKTHLALHLWGYIFANTNVKLIRIKNFRIIVALWIWFTFFILSFYNTAFYSSLTYPTKKKITCLTQTLDSVPFKPCISENTRIFFKYKYNETLPGEATEKCKNTYISLDTVANSNEFYALERDYTYWIRQYKYVDEKGNNKLQGFRYTDDIMFALYMRRGFPLRDKFQRYVLYHVESGLFNIHHKRIQHQYYMNNRGLTRGFHAFSLSDFRIHYSVLLVGYLVSCICFIVEIKFNSKK